jgi:DNA-nicking Smr family endonuclease
LSAESDDEDGELFRHAVRDVKPLGGALPSSPARRFRFQRRERPVVPDEKPAALPSIEREDELTYRRPGLQLSVLRKLRGGEFGVQGEIDLHGLTGNQAEQALLAFLNNALSRQARCVRIIHGKGLRSQDRLPVLKNVVSSVLRRMPTVVAFVSAPQKDGGTGATYVLLRG